MPTTRAFSARLQAASLSPAKALDGGNSDDIDAIKTRQSQSRSKQEQQQRDLPSVRMPSSVSTQGLDRILRKPRITRNASSPICTLAGGGDSKRSAFSSSSNVPPARSSGGRSAGPRRSTSSISSRRSILGSERMSDSEPSDDENSVLGRGRLGGCSQQSQGGDEPDDVNKENVAPFRCAGIDVLNQEARDAQEESVARRTRGRRSSLMERQTSSIASSADSTPRGAAAAPTAIACADLARRAEALAGQRTIATSSSSLGLPRTPSKRATRSRTDLAVRSSPSTFNNSLLSTPQRPALNSSGSSSSSSSSRKRSRQTFSDDTENQGPRTPGTPFSRMRLSPRKATAPSSSVTAFDHDDMDSYFGSQASSATAGSSSLFDTLSQAGSSSSAASTAIASREPSPAAQDVLAKASSGLSATASTERYSNVYSHARALLRYAAGVDPAETEAGLTICGGGDRQTESHVKVVGRAKERVAIEQFLDQRLGLFPDAHARAEELDVELDGDTESGCLYVCGLAGTGKTALVRSVLNSLGSTGTDRTRPPRIAFVNCMTLTHPRFIFGKVLSALGSDAAEGQSDAEAERAISSLIREGGQRILIVLDEMDHLLHSRAHQNVLYRLFSWALPSTAGEKQRRSAPSCSLIGIANSLDLTERFVPLLASKGASPALLHFRPFEATEIVNVIRDRLSGLLSSYDGAIAVQTVQAMEVDANTEARQATKRELPLFTASAVELLANKIAAATGDLRKALDAARLAIEMVEAEQRKKALAEATVKPAELASASTSASDESKPETEQGDVAIVTAVTTEPASVRTKVLSHLTPATAAKAGPSQILKVLATVLGSPNLSKIRNLGLQPKLVLLSLLVADLRAKEGLAILGSASGTQAPRVSKGSLTSGLRLSEVESTYASLLKNDGTFSALESSELLSVFELLEVQGILKLCSEAGSAGASSSSSSSSSLGVAVMSSGVSPSGKRAAKKQLLAANRIAILMVAGDDVLKGITTAPPVPLSASSAASASASSGVCSTTLVETIRRIWLREEDRVVRSRGWEAMAREKEAVRKKELGGGRGQVAIGL